MLKYSEIDQADKQRVWDEITGNFEGKPKHVKWYVLRMILEDRMCWGCYQPEGKCHCKKPSELARWR
jgi:hypothetical protein